MITCGYYYCYGDVCAASISNGNCYCAWFRVFWKRMRSSTWSF